MKKFFALVLALVMALSLTTVAWGAVNDAATLQSAFNAGGNVVLDDSFTVADTEITVPAGKSVVLDLNGKTLSFTGSGMIRVFGELTVNGTGAIASANRPAIMMGQYDVPGTGAKLTVNGGTISSATFAAIQGNGTAGTNSNQNTVIVINGGVITAATADGIYHPQAGSLTITGGEITGYSGIAMKSGTLTITGGKIKGTGAYLDTLASSQNGIETDGSAICIDSNVGYAGGMEVSISGNAELVSANGHIIRETGVDNEITSISVTGGTFTAADKEAINLQDATPAAIASVSGGTFNTDVSEYVADGNVFVNGEVQKATPVGNTISYNVKDLTVIEPDGTKVDVSAITSVIKVASVTNTTIINGKTTTTFVPAYYQLAAGSSAGTFVECDKSVADYMFTIKNVGSVFVREMAVPAAFDATPVALYTAPKTATCGMVGANEDTYIVVDGKYYPTKVTTGAQYGLLNGNMVVFDQTASTAKAHNFNGATVETYNSKYPNMVDTVKCPDCKGIITLTTKPGSFDGKEYVKVVTTNTALHSYTYYYVAGAVAVQTPAAGTTSSTVQSAQTFDAGIAMYVGMSVMAAAGGAVVIGKKKD